MSRLGIRRRLLLAVLAAVCAALAAMIVGFNLLLARNLSGDANDLLRARAAAELGRLETGGNSLRVAEAPDDAALDTDVWIFSRKTVVEAPARSAGLSQAARRLAASASRFAEVPPEDVRLYAVPVVAHGRRLGTVVTGVSLAPYEETRRTALVGSLGLGAALLLLVFLAARWLLESSLLPVARMTRQAAAWSEWDLDRRFALGEPRDELTELAATLDGLLDRLAASLRREQTFSAELSHELRTPLSRLSAEVELALRRERTGEEYRAALGVVQRSAQQLARTVDALVAAARQAASGHGTADAFAVAEEVVGACAGLAAERRLAVDLEPPSRPLRIGVDAELAERVLQPVIENACLYSRRQLRITMARRNGAVVYSVDDDGPGIGADESETIFEPGKRGQAGREDGNAGAGLGLALARRLARAAAGEVEAVADDSGGHFLIRLPSGQPCSPSLR